MSTRRSRLQGSRSKTIPTSFSLYAPRTISFLGKIGVVVIWMMVCAKGMAQAEPKPSVSLYLFQTYADNLFGNYAPTSDWISSGDVEIRYGEFSGLFLVYRGIVYRFAAYTDLLNHRHQGELLYRRALGGERNALYAGTQVQIRRDRPLYVYYDHNQWRGYMRVKYYLTPETLGRFGYEIRVRSHPQYEEGDFLVQEVFVQLNRFLQTRTTLRIQLGWGAKRYHTQSAWIAGGTVYQAMLEAKIAQSVGTRTGIQMRYRHRSDPSRSWRDERGDGYYEENPFEDRYSYGGWEIQSVVKHRGPWGMALEFSGTMLAKRYKGVSAFDLNGLPVDPEQMRKDQQARIYVGVEQPLDAWLTDHLPGTSLRLEYVYTRNASNDPYYEYTAHSFSSGVGIYF